MADSLPERIKMKITIEIDAPSDALEEIPKMIDNAIDGVKFGSASGNGFLLGQKGSYRYTVEDNLPRKPATLETLFEMFDGQLAPGELTSEVSMAILAVGGEDALQWWTQLGEHGRYSWINKPGINTPIDAWQEYRRQQGH
ncbi:hypothetical protein JOY19_33465 (plasmid) [Pseudomonas aeruginosa]|jgi:hypothetical protein|uniref:Uncharacterized protein n=3 Tax=Pseudomonas TaxID=286 RepID=A0A7S6K7Q6_PSEAI|nr:MULTISPECIES: hypothetical protein [Pseudomonas]WQN29982.1 hypothetical protein ULE26_23310 [Stutzerimonas stutzeri]AGL45977.1 hypothetical protein pOZ176_012 [Pseudomonas aeruginosa PA96]ANI18730.1 hypothetical protein A9C11_32230 [Pseudomonas citronellolis]EIU1447261.1 hypothetical protein [Pseudomonas aeruginosa]EIU3125543.1 hypothetical protein [Pseudomonas aeruginosa]